MPIIKVSHIISFSSEDPNFPASNLLRSENYRKWKCKDPGEKKASVLLQLEKAKKIVSIDIGNECSAFVEVFVGRSSQSVEEYKILLLMSSFMSPMESRNVTNTNRVRMFSTDKLDKNSVDEKWDRVKIVCTQPFNKHIQYGLSFINLHSPSDKADSKNQSAFGGFTLRDEAKDDIKAGSLFEGYKEKHGLGLLKGAAAIREASTSEGTFVSKAQIETKTLLKEIEKKKKNDTKTDEEPRKRLFGIERSKKMKIYPDINTTTTSDSNANHSTSKGLTFSDTKESREKTKEPKKEPQKRNVSSEEIDYQAKRRKAASEPLISKKCQSKPFNKLFEGVVFVISGFQNPLRGNLRSKALEMGAKYKPDWESCCTHLVCAFPNTPKFMQVLGKGHIVSKNWIEDSYAKRKRLPWRRYAMAKHEKGKEESEEEILEETEEISKDQQSDVFCSAEMGAPSGSDTDDEIQRCMRDSVICEKPEEKRCNSRDCECYNCETEEDESEEMKQNVLTKNGKLPLTVPQLPDFFNNFVFYILPKVDTQTRTELNRYIVAFNGKVAASLNEEVTHILCKEMDDVEKFSAKKNKPKIVKIQWIWDCNDAGKIIPTEKYLIH